MNMRMTEVCQILNPVVTAHSYGSSDTKTNNRT